METDFLAHHGVKGQKWGVRRHQNKDGSLNRSGQNERTVYTAYRKTVKKKSD